MSPNAQMSDAATSRRDLEVSVAHVKQQGDRNTMEDFAGRFSVGDRYEVTYVCDGHGGDAIARHLSEGALETAVAEALHSPDAPVDMKERMRRAFLRLDDEIKGIGAHKTGSTVCMLILDTEECTLHAVNCGDSRCMVLACKGEPVASVVPLLTTRDHSGANILERRRIMDAGGIVIQYRGVYRVMGTLAVTRALGDHCMKEYVIGEPDVCTVVLRERLAGDNKTRVLCVLATDGLWHYVSNDAVIAAVRRNLEGNKGHAALPAALLRLVEDSNRHMDNTTIVAIEIV